MSASLVRVGQSWRTILEVADEVDADLIVIGSHGYYGIDRVLGTTAGKVANLARRNVLVVHEQAPARDEPAPPRGAATEGPLSRLAASDTFGPTRAGVSAGADPRRGRRPS